MGDFSGLYDGNATPPDGGSPDTANAFFADGKLGQIGPRKGRTLLQAANFPNTLYGVQRLILPSGSRRWTVSSNDGATNEQAAPLSVAGSGSLGASAQLFTFNRTTLTVAFPDASAETTLTLNTTKAAFTSKEILFPQTYIITGTINAPDTATVDIQYYLCDSGGNDIDDLGDPNNVLDRMLGAKTALTLERDPSGFQKATTTTSGTLAKIKFRATVTGSGVAGYSFTFGPFDRFWIR